jgi:hypothetical protein
MAAVRTTVLRVRAALVLAVVTVVVVAVGSATAAPPHPDPPPGAHKKATVSGAYWIDMLIYVNGRLVHGARARCLVRTHYRRRCFVIRVGKR